ncbi:MAG: ribonuclease PH [Acidobacteria bacterium]|nr:ribonuclease PH [Acidobacteriota bacterium]
MRHDGRDGYAVRPILIQTDYNIHAEGSCLICCGNTRVLCTVSLDEKVPPFLKGSGTGWITAEYGMLPRSTSARSAREAARGKLSGRTQEIQRLIGRSLRAVANLDILGERTLIADCDVLQADGGTRTAAVSGAFVAMVLAVDKLMQKGILETNPLLDFLAGVSVGIVDNRILLDLDYYEDSRAEVDLNLVCSGDGRLVEIQGTAEAYPFTDEQFFEMLEIAKLGIQEIIDQQKQALDGRVNLQRLFPHLE